MPLFQGFRPVAGTICPSRAAAVVGPSRAPQGMKKGRRPRRRPRLKLSDKAGPDQCPVPGENALFPAQIAGFLAVSRAVPVYPVFLNYVVPVQTVLLAIIVFAEGQGIHDGPDVQYGLKVVYEGSRYIDNAGWYMDEAQPLATMFVLPAVISLLGSYMICREEEDDTMKSLRLIPVDEGKLVAAKMMIAFVFSVLLYLLLFSITFLTEALLHFSDLSVELVLSCMKEYLLDGIGVFLAISPIIAVVPCMKKSYWLALVFTELYSIAGLFAGMSSRLLYLYPIDAIFNLSGYHITTIGKKIVSILVLLLCGCLSVLLLKGLNRRDKKE